MNSLTFYRFCIEKNCKVRYAENVPSHVHMREIGREGRETQTHTHSVCVGGGGRGGGEIAGKREERR